MTASFNTSFFNTSAAAENRVCKNGFRDAALNNFTVDVVDFDNEVFTYEVEAASEAEASEMAEQMAMAEGVQVSYCKGDFAPFFILVISSFTKNLLPLPSHIYLCK